MKLSTTLILLNAFPDKKIKSLGNRLLIDISKEYKIIDYQINLFLQIYKNINVEKSMTLGVKLKDTVFKMAGNHVVETFDRNDMISVQTPQAFHKEALLKAHELARKEMFYGTDDTMLMAKYLGINAYVIQGDYRNIKLTTLDDIKFLEVVL